MEPRKRKPRGGLTEEQREGLDRLSLFVSNLPPERRRVLNQEVLKVGRPPKSEESIMVSVRLPPSLLARVDEYGTTLQKNMPGVNITRADAIRQLLEKALHEGKK